MSTLTITDDILARTMSELAHLPLDDMSEAEYAIFEVLQAHGLMRASEEGEYENEANEPVIVALICEFAK